MQQYIESSDRELGHRRHPYRKQKRTPVKQTSPSKEELLNKYQKQLKDILQQSPNKKQSYVQPLRNHLFLDWQEDDQTKKRSRSNATAQMKSIEAKRTSKLKDGSPDNTNTNLSNHKSQSLRKSDKLIMSRYDTLNEHGIARMSRRYQLPEKLASQHYNMSNNQPAFVLPSIAERKLDVLPTTHDKSIVGKPQKLKTQPNDAPTRKFLLPTSEQLKQGSYTVTDYRPSRLRSPQKDSIGIDRPANISGSIVKDYLSEHRSPIKRPQPLRQTLNDSEFTRTQQSLSQFGKFGKKTVFYKKLYNEKQAAELSSLSKKIKRPIDVPDKDVLPTFLSSYQSLDPTFDFKSLLQQPNFGIVRFKDAIYIGECFAGDEGKQLRHGRGIYITKRFQFQGEFSNNEKKYGTEITEQGIYKGQFKGSMRNGKGEFRWHNGQYYNGEWQNNKKHGSGIWTSSVLGGDSQVPDSYMGQWQNGNVQGYGVHTWNNGKSRYEGEFKGFLKHGSGVEKFQNGDRYEGHYLNGKAQGYGEYFWADGSYYKGSFVGGLREGKGVWLQSSKDLYEGFLKEDCKHGKGVVTYSNGDIFEGNFDMDSRQGPGILTIASRQEIIKGVWKNNQLETS